MGSKKTYQEKKEFSEEFSLIFEKNGKPRIYGLILGWLLICDPPQQSFSELVEHLQVSKSSVSTMTRMLLQAGLIKKVRLPGKRQIHFQIKEGAGTDVLQNELELITSLRQISEKGLQLLDNEPDTDQARLKKMLNFYTFAANQLPCMIQNYKTEKNDS